MSDEDEKGISAGMPVLDKGFPGEVLRLGNKRLADSDIIPLLKPLLADTLDKLDELLLREPAWEPYARPKRMFFERHGSIYTPVLRCGIARGTAERGVISSEGIEGKIHRLRGTDFAEDEKEVMAEELDRLGLTVTRQQLYEWIEGKVVAPRDWKNYAALSEINSVFRDYYTAENNTIIPSKSMQEELKVYNAIRSSMMRAAEELKNIIYSEPQQRDELLRQFRSRCNETNHNGIVSEGIDHMIGKLPEEEVRRSFEYIEWGKVREMIKKGDRRTRERLKKTMDVIRKRQSPPGVSIKNPNELYQDFLVLTTMFGEAVSLYALKKNFSQILEAERNSESSYIIRGVTEKLMPKVNAVVDRGPAEKFTCMTEEAKEKYSSLISSIAGEGTEGIDRELGIDPSSGYSVTSLVRASEKIIDRLPHEFKKYVAYRRILREDKAGPASRKRGSERALSKDERKQIQKTAGRLRQEIQEKYGFTPSDNFSYTIDLREHTSTLREYCFEPLLNKWEKTLMNFEEQPGPGARPLSYSPGQVWNEPFD